MVNFEEKSKGNINLVKLYFVTLSVFVQISSAEPSQASVCLMNFINSFAFSLIILKKSIAFSGFESILMFLISSICFFP